MLQQYLETGYRLIIVQLILLSIISGFFLITQDFLSCISVLLGGGAWVIPNWYFVCKLFKKRNCSDAQTLLKSFFIAEGVKLLLSIGLIVLIVLFFTIETWAFLCGYIAAITASLLTPFWYRNKK